MELWESSVVEWLVLSSLLLPVALLSLIVVSVFKSYNCRCNSGKRMNFPPFPLTSWPLLGNVLQLRNAEKPLHRFVEDLHREHGPIVGLRMGVHHQVFIGSSTLAKECLENQNIVFASRPKRAAQKYLSFGADDVATVPYGDHWKYLRGIYTDELLSPKRMPRFQSIIAEEMSLFVRSTMRQQRGSDPIYVNLHKRVLEITLNVLTMMMMGARSFPYEDILKSDDKEFGRVFTSTEIADLRTRGPDWREYTLRIHKLFSTRLVEDSIPLLGCWDVLSGTRTKMKRVKRRLVELYRDMIKDHKLRRETSPPTEADTTLLDLLLAMPGPNGEPQLSETSIMSLLESTAASGSNSSASTIEWAMSHLLKNPDCMKEAKNEMDLVVGLERSVEETDIASLPYLRAIVKETLRLTPTGPLLIPHATTSDCKVGEYDIPAKTAISFNVWAIGRDPTVWDQPLKFQPQRFLKSEIDLRGQHFELFPFGSGERICPAIDVALSLVQMTVATLIQSFDWSLPGEMAAEELDMSEAGELIITRSKPLEGLAIPRLSRSLF